MMMRELENGEAAPRRKKASFEDYMVRKGINDNLPPEQRMEKLHALFMCFAGASAAILDNLQPGELTRRLSDPQNVCTTAQMKSLLEEGDNAVGLLARCVDEMAKSPLSRVNGTSLAFAQCSSIFATEQERLETGKREFAGLFLPSGNAASEAKTPACGLSAKLVCLSCQMAAMFLVIEDAIAA